MIPSYDQRYNEVEAFPEEAMVGHCFTNVFWCLAFTSISFEFTSRFIELLSFLLFDFIVSHCTAVQTRCITFVNQLISLF